MFLEHPRVGPVIPCIGLEGSQDLICKGGGNRGGPRRGSRLSMPSTTSISTKINRALR
jgi:hypothetical protein